MRGCTIGSRLELHCGEAYQGRYSYGIQQYHPINYLEKYGKRNKNFLARASLDRCLSGVPGKIPVEYADQLMQGLDTLSPRILQQRLGLCNSVKIRRLFFGFAERQGYTWLNQLDQNNIDFGSGNRVIVKGGRFDKKYKKTVPDIFGQYPLTGFPPVYHSNGGD